MNEALSLWVEIPVGILLLISAAFTLAAAIGVLRFKTFFMRMHPPALAFTLASWCVSLATMIYFSALEQGLALHAWLIIILLALTVPVTTIMLARTALFRIRTDKASTEKVPPAFSARP
ncbi:Na+/H+ antiporter subunit G [Roseateles oligotrophus]|uniref:Na+/H+ antiporter subunit G n=1 Tax=Roseateles oligotrophus TaxID=1769250 RepID=A0ABT2YKD4_9BURK|nr:Na+/H+ antiporter subunit G [Roseateles oligotrophus]MCV2370513.1 Na+/H+ antiporter subunit G [Roseateles oligotrophus]